MKIGNVIKTKGIHKGIEGTNIKIVEGVDRENQGSIHIIVTKITDRKKYSWLEVGDSESFSHFGWQDDMDIIV